MGFASKPILSHPKAGASFETFCIEQLVAHAARVDPDPDGIARIRDC